MKKNKYLCSADVKDQIELAGNDIALVSLTAAKIQQATNVRHKALHKFLDGMYVSEKKAIPDAFIQKSKRKNNSPTLFDA
eukprot:10913996-Ditylum_brightwellii.AAC.1